MNIPGYPNQHQSIFGRYFLTIIYRYQQVINNASVGLFIGIFKLIKTLSLSHLKITVINLELYLIISLIFLNICKIFKMFPHNRLCTCTL